MLVASGASVAAAPSILAAAGFTSAGVAAGSLAAVWQSKMAAISGGSLFASLQSMSMAGLGLTGSLSLGGTTGAAAMAFCKGVDKLCNGCIDYNTLHFSSPTHVEASLVLAYRILEDNGLGSVAEAIIKSSGAESLQDLKELDPDAVKQIVQDAGLKAVLASKFRKALKDLRGAKLEL